MLLLYALPIGLLAGLAAGGSIGRLANLRIRLAPLAIGGLLFQLLLFSRLAGCWSRTCQSGPGYMWVRPWSSWRR
jgi:hypothetical protein